MNENSNWVLTWAQAHASLSLTHFVADNMTYRLVVKSAISGEKIRVRLSNECSKNDVRIGAVTCAHCDMNGRISSDAEITTLSVNNSTDFTLEAGKEQLCDEVSFHVKANDYLCVSVYVVYGKLESGNSLVNAWLLYEKGDKTQSLLLNHKERTRTGVLKLVTGVAGIAQPLPIPLFESIELLNNDNAKAIILFGDSITQQGKWTAPFEEKLCSLYPSKYSVINKSITGNRVLRDCSKSALLKGFYGKSAKNRIERDVLRYSNVSHVFYNVGINDIIQPGTPDAPKSEKCTADELFNGINELCNIVKQNKLKLAVANFIPFGLSRVSNTSEKEKIRVAVNSKIEKAKNYDYFIDFSSAFENVNETNKPFKEYIGRDGLHPSEKGGKVLCDAIDLSFFSDMETVTK